MSFSVFWRAAKDAGREWRRWSSACADRQSIRVYYGREHIPAPSDVASGGIVKCQDLARRFPNTFVSPNILYLISSALDPHTLCMARFAKRAGARIVVNQNGVAYPAWHGPGWEATNRPMRLLHELADYVFYQSAFCRSSADRFLGHNRSPNEVLHNAVDTHVFRPTRTRSAGSGLVLITAGSHTKRYRVTCAIETLVALRKSGVECRLIVGGKCCWGEEQPSRREAQDFANVRGVADRVEFTGPYSQQDAVDLLNRADILLHPTYNDSCPRLVLEAMACGVPVVCSRSGGTPELVGDTAGVAVPVPLDWEREHVPEPTALAAAVTQIFHNLDAFSISARERAVSRFDVAPWIERHRTVFAELCRAG
jgi:glycosyltransferase involved in cell wall biosynthesis